MRASAGTAVVQSGVDSTSIRVGGHGGAGDDGLRLNDDERGSPSNPAARQDEPEPAVNPRKLGAAVERAAAAEAHRPGFRAGAGEKR
jgi:hypothetical protein